MRVLSIIGLRVLAALMSMGAAVVVQAVPAPAVGPAPATYHVKVVSLTPPKLSVTADLPMEGKALTMDTTRPAGIPELDARGWPAFVSNLRIVDFNARTIEPSSVDKSGWQLDQPRGGRLKLSYEVDYSALAAQGWPAPREAAVADDDHLVVVGRSVFITTPAVRESIVSFELPRGFRPVTPWAQRSGSTKEFAVPDSGDLVENLLVLSRTAPDVVTAGGFRLLVVPMGPWLDARKEVRRVLGAAIPRLVSLAGSRERENYLVVLLPVVEQGGESYRHSFALTFDATPSAANSAIWGNTIAHEVFHLWNGWKLRGADYASTQWFQEGFTEYAANLAMVGAKLIDEKQFLQKLTDHIANYRKLGTALEASGTHKGPPLYSAGALVAFSWDVAFLDLTDGKHGLGDFFQALWKQTDGGTRPYTWSDIEAALNATTPLDWNSFHRAYIASSTLLPLPRTFARVGINLILAADETPMLTINPGAPASAKALWQAILEGR